MGALERRFVFVTGKGGVGKTTVSACLAHALGAAGRTTLLAAADTEPYRALLPKARWQEQPSPAGGNVWTVLLDSDLALKEYGRLLIRPRLARQALFENRYVQGFLAAVPGLPQWAVLGKAWYHTTEEEGGAPRFDSVVFDAPATGHAFEMLRLPKVIMDVAPAGLLRRDAERAWQLFQDARQSAVVLVTLPEELPTNETLELSARITSELGLPLGALVANRMRPLRFDERERALLEQLRAVSSPVESEQRGAQMAIEMAAAYAIAERVQLASIDRLRQIPAPLLALPELIPDTPNPAWLRDLGALLLKRDPSRDT